MKKRFLPFFATVLVLAASSSVSEDQRDSAKKEEPRAQIVAGTNDTFDLIRNPKVRAEMRLTDQQARQIDDVIQEVLAEGRKIVMASRDDAYEEWRKRRTDIKTKFTTLAVEANKEIEMILMPQQLTRIEQIAVQSRGLFALSTRKVAQKLKLSEDQLERIAAARAEAKDRHEQLGAEFAVGIWVRTEVVERGQQIQEQMERKIMDVLTMEQQMWFKQMQGEKFEFARPNPFSPPVPTAGQ